MPLSCLNFCEYPRSWINTWSAAENQDQTRKKYLYFKRWCGGFVGKPNESAKNFLKKVSYLKESSLFSVYFVLVQLCGNFACGAKTRSSVNICPRSWGILFRSSTFSKLSMQLIYGWRTNYLKLLALKFFFWCGQKY